MHSNQQPQPGAVVIDYRSLLTWIATAIIVYSLLSGLALQLLSFSVFVQYSILIHTSVGLISIGPLFAIEYFHWQRRKRDATIPVARVAIAAMLTLGLCLLT